MPYNVYVCKDFIILHLLINGAYNNDFKNYVGHNYKLYTRTRFEMNQNKQKIEKGIVFSLENVLKAIQLVAREISINEVVNF